MKSIITFFLTISCILLLHVGCADEQNQPTSKKPIQYISDIPSSQVLKSKKLIEYGWDVPSPKFVQQNIQQMEKRPFDGIVIKLEGGTQILRHQPYKEENFNHEIESLKATKFSKFTNNFVLLRMTPDNGWDWFSDSDWSASKQNIRLFAKIVREGGMTGFAFDAEPYGMKPWMYSKLPSAREKSFEQHWQQVRQRGAEFMQILQDELPNIKLLCLFQMSYLSSVMNEPNEVKLNRELSRHSYGLLPAFLNGMLDTTKENTVIIDGNEIAYYYSGKEDFFGGHDIIKKQALSLIDPKNHSKYKAQVQLGHALYIDHLFALSEPEKKASHYLNSKQKAQWLEHNTYYALTTSDKYVWCYSEEMDWWKNKVPPGIEEAILSARNKLEKRQPLGFSIEEMVKRAQEKVR